MYPTLYDLVLDLFGVSIPAFKMMQSYGMMVSLGFAFGAVLMMSELKRKEANGQITPVMKKVWKGKKTTISTKAMYAAIGFLFGYKLVGLYLNFDTVAEHAKDYLISMEGSVPGGILGSAIALAVAFWEDRKESGVKPHEVEEHVPPIEHVGNIVLLGAIGGIVGAKVFHNLENMDDLLADPIHALLSFSGFSYYGGMICAIALIIWYTRKNGMNTLNLLDGGIPALALGYGFGRLGCQVAGDGDWGIPNDSPKPDWLSFLPDWMWAYDYPNNVLGVDMIEFFAKKGYVSLTGFAYPTPVYEIIMSVMIFAFLWGMRKRWVVPGVMICAYLILGGLERLLIEQIRINNEYDILGGITQAEIISVAMVLAGSAALVYLRKKNVVQT